MTSTPNDKPLAEDNLSIKLQELLSKYDINDRDFVKMIQLILSDREEAENKARIDELKNIPRTRSKQAYIENRLVQLQPNKRKVESDE